MRISDLIARGVCEDLEEALQMFPLELLDGYGSGTSTTGGPCPCDNTDRLSCHDSSGLLVCPLARR